MLVLAAAAGVVVATDPFAPGAKPTGGVADNAYPTSITTVARRSLSSQTSVDATLGYAGSYTVANQEQGIFTALPAVGQVITQGHGLYSVDGSPVVLLYGSTPAYRSLSSGMSGADVQQLNADLVALGDATSAQIGAGSDQFTSATASALDKLQAALGLPQSGTVPLGQGVFAPSAIRVTAVNANLGGGAGAGQTALAGTSTTRQVTIALDAALQSQVKVGDRVTITLPDNQTTPGVISSVGTVATTPSSSGGPGASSSPTVTVEVTPTDPAATGSLDQAPVQVLITTASVNDALVVPINALLALAGGAGYALEVVRPDGVHTLVPVSTGLFDDADQLVQVTGAGLRAGQRVVVPAP